MIFWITYEKKMTLQGDIPRQTLQKKMNEKTKFGFMTTSGGTGPDTEEIARDGRFVVYADVLR